MYRNFPSIYCTIVLPILTNVSISLLFLQIELENLNTATDDINKLEIELEVR